MAFMDPLAPGYVDKLLVPAYATFPGPERVEGAFTVSARSPLRPGPESLLELLNSPQRMLPFIRSADDVVLLVARLSIDWVEVDPEVPGAHVRPATFLVTREEHVQVRLTDGRLVEGVVSMELPDHLNRISDYLNLDEDFFALTGPSGTVLINKARVQGVRLFESSPRPVGSTGI